MFSLANKNILLIAPIFFNYHNDIKLALERLGANVDFLPDRPLNTPLWKALIRLNPKLIMPYADHFYCSKVPGFERRHYDHILVIQGELVSQKTLAFFRTTFPNAQLVWYLWDSIENKPFLKRNLQSFDRCLTFDHIDAKSYGMDHRELFFNDHHITLPESYDYDLCFIGTAHSDRYKVCQKLKSALPDPTRFYTYFYLQAPWLLWYLKAMDPNFSNIQVKDFNFTQLNASEVRARVFSSRAVVDIEHPKQVGLTMRTFESIGAGKKLVTTNSSILSSDIYHPDNILLLDRRSMDGAVNMEFFSSPFTELPEKVLRKYSLDYWLKDILLGIDKTA
jgi:hypothetical protein